MPNHHWFFVLSEAVGSAPSAAASTTLVAAVVSAATPAAIAVVRQVTWDLSLGRRCAHLFYRAAGAVLDSLPAGHLGSNTLELYASISCPALKGQLKQKAHIRIFKGTVTQITKR